MVPPGCLMLDPAVEQPTALFHWKLHCATQVQERVYKPISGTEPLKMTQGKLFAANKSPNPEGEQGGPEKWVPMGASVAPPTYEEATASVKNDSPSPSAPMHPSWAYVDPSRSPSYGSGGFSGESEMFSSFSWDDKNVRRIFIRKVYIILMIQLSFTAGVIALFTFCDPVKIYIQAHPGWYWASYAVFFVTYLTLACCSGPRRYFPWNLILLTIFTASFACMLGFISSYYNTKSVLLCFAITALVCFAVTIFSFQTKFDFTSCQGVLFVLLLVLCISGFVLAIVLPFQYVPWLHAIYAVLGAIIFTMFLAFDTQMLIGNCRYAISPEEYIFGALNIYLDIIYIFTFMLQIFGSSRE
ncbi:fas apoptotic inhibitory molecule 2b isoform X2 [Narcine bancroftii]|uniref:fas apoptotic inhibitory molecule 2b isoform X2 n=1 Tax=Narcine bancroftii TaxID=1343680 RepID=UPI003831EC6E